MKSIWDVFRDSEILDNCKECGARASILEKSTTLFATCTECANSTDKQDSVLDAMLTWNKSQRGVK